MELRLKHTIYRINQNQILVRHSSVLNFIKIDAEVNFRPNNKSNRLTLSDTK